MLDTVNEVDITEGPDITAAMRPALGQFPTGVTIVTSLDADATPRAITANSFTSVSMNPPMVLVCIDNRSSSRESIGLAGQFGVQFLHAEQWPTALAFARPGEGKFDHIAWKPSDRDIPLLEEYAISLECSIAAEYPGGDHTIYLGEVEAIRTNRVHEGILGFFQGRFVRLDSQSTLFERMSGIASSLDLSMLW